MREARTKAAADEALDMAIECFRRMKARRHRLDRAARDVAEEVGHLDEAIADAEADLAVHLREAGPRVVDEREYRHATRHGCDVVEVVPARGEAP